MQETVLCLEKYFTSLQASPPHPALNACDALLIVMPQKALHSVKWEGHSRATHPTHSETSHGQEGTESHCARRALQGGFSHEGLGPEAKSRRILLLLLALEYGLPSPWAAETDREGSTRVCVRVPACVFRVGGLR